MRQGVWAGSAVAVVVLLLGTLGSFGSGAFLSSTDSARTAAVAERGAKVEPTTAVGESSQATATSVPTATAEATAGATATAAPAATHTVVPPAEPSPSPTAPPALREQPVAASRGGRPVQRIGLQAGHWRSAEHTDELASLRSSTGAAGPGWTETEINLDIARRAARMLEAGGFKVDLLPASVPVRYQADVFLSLHGDGNASSRPRGFKVARGSRSLIPEVDDTLVAAVYRNYGRITGLPRDDKNITNNMRYYYAFAGGRIQHAVAPTTPAAILEMGFLTNPTDRALILGSPDLIAQAVVASLTDFLGR